MSCFYFRTYHVIFSVTVNDSLMNECLIENFINYFLRDWRRFPNHKGTIKICDLKKVTWECDYLCPVILIYFFKKRKRAHYARLVRICMICVQNNGDLLFFGFQTWGRVDLVVLHQLRWWLMDPFVRVLFCWRQLEGLKYLYVEYSKDTVFWGLTN